MDQKDLQVFKIKELFKELRSLFPDKPLNVLMGAIKTYEPHINWASSTRDVQTSIYNTWLQACAEHLLISAEQNTSPGVQRACTLDQAKEAVTDAMVQQVLFMFPDADEDWVKSTLIYSKQRYRDNIVDRTCNFMFDNPNKYEKKNSALVSDSNSSLSGSEQSIRKHKRTDCSLSGLDSLSDKELSFFLSSDSKQPRTKSSGSSQTIKSTPAAIMLSEKCSTSTLSSAIDPEPSTSSSLQKSMPLGSDSKIVKKKTSTSGYLRIDSDLLQLDSSSDEELPSFLTNEFELATSGSSASSKLLSRNPELPTSGLPQNNEAKPSTSGSPYTTLSSVPDSSQKAESKPSTSGSPHMTVSSVPDSSQKAESKPSTSGSPHMTVSSVPDSSQKAESIPSTSGSPHMTVSSVPGSSQKAESKPSTSGSQRRDSKLLHLSSSSDEDLLPFLPFDFEVSVPKPSVSHAVQSGKGEPLAAGVFETSESSSSSSAETRLSPPSCWAQLPDSKRSESSPSSISVGLLPNRTRSASSSSVKHSESTPGEVCVDEGSRTEPSSEMCHTSSLRFQPPMVSGDTSSELCHTSSLQFQPPMASGDTTSVQCPHLSSTGQGETRKVSMRKVESTAKDHANAPARYLAEQLQRKMHQLRCLQRLNSSAGEVSSTSLPINRKRSSSLEGSGTPNQFKRRSVSQPVLPTTTSTLVALDHLNHSLFKEQSKSNLSASRSQPSAPLDNDPVSSGRKRFLGDLPQPCMYTNVGKGKKVLVKRLQGARAPSGQNLNHHRPSNQGKGKTAQMDVPYTLYQYSDASVSNAGGMSRSVTCGLGSAVRDRGSSVVVDPISGNRAVDSSVSPSDSLSGSLRDSALAAEHPSRKTTPKSRTHSPAGASPSSMHCSVKIDSVFLKAMIKRARSSSVRNVLRARSISASTSGGSSGLVSNATSSTLASTSMTPSRRTSAPYIPGRPASSKSSRLKYRPLPASATGRSPRSQSSVQHSSPSTTSLRPSTQLSLLTSTPGKSSYSRATTQRAPRSLLSTSPLSSRSGTNMYMSRSSPGGLSTSAATANHAAHCEATKAGTPGSDEGYLSASGPARLLSTSELSRFQNQPISAGTSSGRRSPSLVPSKPSGQESSHPPVEASTSSAAASDFTPSRVGMPSVTSRKPPPTAVLASSSEESSQSSSESSPPNSAHRENSRLATPPNIQSGSEVLPPDSGLKGVASGSTAPQSPTPKSPDSTNKKIVIIKEDATSSESYILTCESCFLSKDPEGMHQCSDGHVICTKCVEERAKEALSGKIRAVLCPCFECVAVVPKDNLERALPGMILDLLDEKLQTQQESVRSGPDREDFVRCPSCSFGTVLNSTVKRIVCRREDCMAVTCRHCKQSWRGRDHSLCERGSGEESPSEGVNTDPFLQLPSHWSATDMKGKMFIKELVQPSSQEWANIRALFSKTLADAHLKYIHRVQNPRLWRKYCVTRQNMLEDNGETQLNEKILFHGTAPRVVESICREGFDWRMCGRHGVAYGQGAYFARDALYSHRYSAQAQRAPRHAAQPLNTSVLNQIARSYRHLQHPSPTVSGQSERRPTQTSSATTTAYAGHTQYSLNVQSASGSGTSTSSAVPAAHQAPTLASGQVPLVNLSSYPLSLSIQFSGSRPQAKRQVIVPMSLGTRAYMAQNPSASGYNIPQPSTSTAEKEPRRPREHTMYTMFVSKVLVGRSTIGSTEYRKPPRDTSFDDGRTFDSCVDNPDNPRIFVIFDSSQAYPDYVISYTM